MKINIIPKNDIPDVVKVHKSSFQGFFLTELGDHFLNVYYDCVRKDERGVLLGFYEDGQLYGFCAATTLSKGFNAYLVKANLSRFSLIGLRLLITRMPALVRLFKNFTKSNPGIEENGEYAELLSIGVSDKKQGMGIGKKLLLQLEKELQLKGCSKLSLTTDYNDNDKAMNFYKALSYQLYYDFVAYPNRKMYRLIKDLK